jgi:trk system potassium uptake protein TrkH
VILGLIQGGGIGIMTLTTLVLSQIVGSGLRQRAIVSETLGASGKIHLGWILASVIMYTLAFEFVGAVILLTQFAPIMPLSTAIWHSVFHSVSAFCNAGFTLRDSNMTAYKGNLIVNFAICGLIIFGGIGFPVLRDLHRALRRNVAGFWNEIHLHTKLTLLATGIALAFGTIVIAVLEWNALLQGMSLKDRFLVTFFHSVSCRTAGFNTVDLSQMTNASLFITILLMLVGAGACSTAGGIKVSTVAILVAQAISRFRGSKFVNVFRRTIPQHTIDRALITTMFYLLIVGTGITFLLVVDRNLEIVMQGKRVFLDSAFECVSALGTVGLSTGVTPHLSDRGRVIIIALMFLGRLGPITFFAALARATNRTSIEYANEEPLIG